MAMDSQVGDTSRITKFHRYTLPTFIKSQLQITKRQPVHLKTQTTIVIVVIAISITDVLCRAAETVWR